MESLRSNWREVSICNSKIGYMLTSFVAGEEPPNEWPISHLGNFIVHVHDFANRITDPATRVFLKCGPDGSIVVSGKILPEWVPMEIPEGTSFACFFQVQSNDPMGEISFLCKLGNHVGRLYLNTFASQFGREDLKLVGESRCEWEGTEWSGN